MHLGIDQVEMNKKILPLFIESLFEVSQLEVHEYTMNFTPLEALEASRFTFLYLIGYQFWSLLSSSDHKQISHLPDCFFKKNCLNLILCRAFLHLLIDIAEGLKGVDRYFIDGAAHLLQGAEGIDLNWVHKYDGWKDKKNCDEATSDNIDDWINSGTFPVIEDNVIVISLWKYFLDLHVISEGQLRLGYLREILRVFQHLTINLHF